MRTFFNLFSAVWAVIQRVGFPFSDASMAGGEAFTFFITSPPRQHYTSRRRNVNDSMWKIRRRFFYYSTRTEMEKPQEQFPAADV